jgi:cell division septum initiation protein DivIVA
MTELEKFKKENADLKDQIAELLWELNYNKQTELIEFLRTLYRNVQEELKSKSSLTKKQILVSLKKEIEDFAKYTKINLKVEHISLNTTEKVFEVAREKANIIKTN